MENIIDFNNLLQLLELAFINLWVICLSKNFIKIIPKIRRQDLKILVQQALCKLSQNVEVVLNYLRVARRSKLLQEEATCQMMEVTKKGKTLDLLRQAVYIKSTKSYLQINIHWGKMWQNILKHFTCNTNHSGSQQLYYHSQ